MNSDSTFVAQRRIKVDESGAMPGTGVPWDLSAYHARVRAACFVCELVAGTPGYEHDVVHQDELTVAFLAKYPQLWGHILVAPKEHCEHVIGDFGLGEYLGVQTVIHRVGRALAATVPTERLYVLSLGSQQGNRHVHWHLLPLPPGIPLRAAAGRSVRRGQRLDPGPRGRDGRSGTSAL